MMADDVTSRTGADAINAQISVLWEETDAGDQWFEAKVGAFNAETGEHLVEYEDGERQWAVLQQLRVRWLPTRKDKPANLQVDTKTEKKDMKESKSPTSSPAKALRTVDQTQSQSSKQSNDPANVTKPNSENFTTVPLHNRTILTAEEEHIKGQAEEEKEENNKFDDEVPNVVNITSNAPATKVTAEIKISPEPITELSRKSRKPSTNSKSIPNTTATTTTTANKSIGSLLIKAKLLEPSLGKLLTKRLEFGPDGLTKLKEQGYPKLSDNQLFIGDSISQTFMKQVTAASHVSEAGATAAAGGDSTTIDDMRLQFLAIQREMDAKDLDEEDDDDDIERDYPAGGKLSVQTDAQTITSSSSAAMFGPSSPGKRVANLRKNLRSGSLDGTENVDMTTPLAEHAKNADGSSDMLATTPGGTPLVTNGGADDTEQELFELPPALTRHARHLDMDDIRLQFENAATGQEELPKFESETIEKQIVVGTISKDHIDKHRLKMEENVREHHAKQLEMFKASQDEIVERERTARQRVLSQKDQAESELVRKENRLTLAVRERESYLRRLLRRKTQQMKESLRMQEAVIRDHFGKIELGKGSGVFGSKKTMRVNWNRQPQPVAIRVDLLRALKDKVPRGRYVVHVGLYDRLGGEAIRWSKVTPGSHLHIQMSPATKPAYHAGRSYDTDLVFGEPLFALCPPTATVVPSMVFVLEIFRLGDSNRSRDRVVGWTVLPAVTKSLDYTNGKFRLPVMAGPFDRKVDKFSRIQGRYSRNLDSWLCNMYLDVSPLPREYISRVDNSVVTEFELEKTALRDILNLRDENGKLVPRLPKKDLRFANFVGGADASQHSSNVINGISIRDGNNGNANRSQDRDASDKTTDSTKAKRVRAHHRVGALKSDFWRKGSVMSTVESVGGGGGSSHSRSGSGTAGTTSSSYRLRYRGGSTSSPSNFTAANHGTLRQVDSFAISKHHNHMTGSTGGDHTDGGGEAASANITSSSHKQRKSRVHYEGEETYLYAVERRLNAKTPSTAERLKFIYFDASTDLSVRKLWTADFWIAVGAILLAFWSSIYVHYLGQWLYLTSAGAAVFDFRVLIHRAVLKYSWQTLPPYKELLVVVGGPLSCTLVFVLFMLCGHMMSVFLGTVPVAYSRWTAAFGFAALFNPLQTFVVDVVSRNMNCGAKPECEVDPFALECWCSEGDAFKLYYRFLEEQGSGFAGILLVVVVYVSLFFLNLVLIYVYMVNLHMNGRILDVHKRLHMNNRAFFVPHDFEVSSRELRSICERAQRWQGPDGSHREIYITQRTLRDDAVKSFAAETVDVRVCTVSLDGQASLWRHFMRDPEGTILELFSHTDSARASKRERRNSRSTAGGQDGVAGGSQGGGMADLAVAIDIDPKTTAETPKNRRKVFANGEGGTSGSSLGDRGGNSSASVLDMSADGATVGNKKQAWV